MLNNLKDYSLFIIALCCIFLFLGSRCDEQTTVSVIAAGEVKRPLSIQCPVCKKCFEKDLFGSEVAIDPSKINVAAIVEPRLNQGLESVVRAVKRSLGDQWLIQIFHGLRNKAFVEKEFAQEIAEGSVIPCEINVDNLTLYDYNGKLISNPYFWEKMVGENVLSFETDSILCKDNTADAIQEFLQYDYVGAPWRDNLGFECNIFQVPGNNLKYVISGGDASFESLAGLGYINIKHYHPKVGNSGLCLRKRSKMISLLNNYLPAGITFLDRSSDIYIACAASDPGSGFSVPSAEDAERFAVESIYYSSPIGVHKPWLFLSPAEVGDLSKQCPNLEILRQTYKF